MKLFGNASIYLGANILNAAIPFLLLPILTRVLTPAEYGTVAMFLVMVSIFSAFTGLSVHGAIGIRYFQLSKEALAEYVTSCIGILIVSTSAVLAIVVLFGQWLVPLSGLPLDWLIVAVLVSGLQFLANIRLSLWQVAGKAWHYGGFQISRSLLDALLSLFLVLGLSMAWQGRVLGQSLTALLIGIVALVWLYKDQLLRRTNTWKTHSKDALRFGIPLIPHVLGGILIATSNQLLIKNILSIKDAGIYAVAIQLGGVMGVISDAFVKAYGPWLYHKLQNQLKYEVVLSTYLCIVFFIITGLFVSVAFNIITPYLVGKDFSNSTNLLTIVIFANAVTGMYYSVAGFLFFSSKTSYISFITILSGLFSVVVSYQMILRYELIGAALGMLLFNCLSLILTWILSQYITPMPWLTFRSYKKQRNTYETIT